MSSSLNVYFEDVSEVRACYGCKDESLRKGVQRRFRSEIAHYDKWFADDSSGRGPPLKDALGEILTGKIESPAYGAQYGYAFLLLCKYVGTETSNEWFKDFRSWWLPQVKIILTLVESGPPVPIPVADFPAIGFV